MHFLKVFAPNEDSLAGIIRRITDCILISYGGSPIKFGLDIAFYKASFSLFPTSAKNINSWYSIFLRKIMIVFGLVTVNGSYFARLFCLAMA